MKILLVPFDGASLNFRALGRHDLVLVEQEDGNFHVAKNRYDNPKSSTVTVWDRQETE